MHHPAEQRLVNSGLSMSEMTLYDSAGNRLYLNAEERAAFLAVARKQHARDRASDHGAGLFASDDQYFT